MIKGTNTLITVENCLEHGFKSVEEYNKATICAPYIPESITGNKETCKWKHQGGCIIASCDNTHCITDYGNHTDVHKFISHFKFCPLCGNQIELPKWMNKNGKWNGGIGIDYCEDDYR